LLNIKKTQKIKWWAHLHRMYDINQLRRLLAEPPRNKNQRTDREMK
jgi:hypothetical protein